MSCIGLYEGFMEAYWTAHQAIKGYSEAVTGFAVLWLGWCRSSTTAAHRGICINGIGVEKAHVYPWKHSRLLEPQQALGARLDRHPASSLMSICPLVVLHCMQLIPMMHSLSFIILLPMQLWWLPRWWSSNRHEISRSSTAYAGKHYCSGSLPASMV
jgi:hypothetical protein